MNRNWLNLDDRYYGEVARDSMQISKERLGRMLIWLGVLAWAPYILLMITGETRSVIPFLVLHLTGVIGGIKLRRGDNMVSPQTISINKAITKANQQCFDLDRHLYMGLIFPDKKFTGRAS